MATIPVMNPPHKRRGKLVLKRKRVRRRHRRRIKRARPILKKRVRRIRRKRIVHRKRQAAVKSHKKHHRKKRRVSHRRRSVSKRRLVNPFGGEMIMLGNPSHKRHRRKKHMARHRRRHKRRHYALSNPFSVKGILSRPKEMFTKSFAMDALGAAIGLAGTNIALGYVPANFRNSTFKLFASKVGVIVGLSALTGAVSRRVSQMVLIGGGASLLLDLWALWQARTTPAPAPGTSAYYGDQGTGAFYGDMNMGDDIVLSDSE